MFRLGLAVFLALPAIVRISGEVWLELNVLSGEEKIPGSEATRILASFFKSPRDVDISSSSCRITVEVQ